MKTSRLERNGSGLNRQVRVTFGEPVRRRDEPPRGSPSGSDKLPQLRVQVRVAGHNIALGRADHRPCGSVT